MNIYYLISSLFFILFFPRMLTDVICFGKHRDQQFVKSKMGYWLIYSLWTLFFGGMCLIMGSMSGVDHTFDTIYDSYKLYFTECNYTENQGMKPNDPRNNMFTLEYYVKINEDHMEDVIIHIIEDNGSIYREYKLNSLCVNYLGDNRYIVYCGEVMISTVEIKKAMLLKKLIFQWDREKLEKILQQGG